VDEVVSVGVRAVDGKGTGDDAGDGDRIETVDHPLSLEYREVSPLPGERRRDAGH
jgi:hypothetical protein